MNKMLIVILMSFLSFQSVLAETSKVKKTIGKTKVHDDSLRKEMNQISKKIRLLGPLLASETEFSKKENQSNILKILNDLHIKFQGLTKHPTIEMSGLSINQVVMSEELKNVVHLVENGKPVLGRAKLLSTLNLCVSCHAQSPGRTEAKLFSDEDITKFKINNLEKAELYFVTRDYVKAMALYKDFLDQSKKSDDDELILKALERELIYFIKIKKDFGEAKSFFSVYIESKKFSDSVLGEVSDWVKMLDNKPLWENYDPSKVKEDEMDAFLKKFISDDEEGPIFTSTNSSEVFDLNLSSILLDYLNAHPETKLGAKILYWLAILDKRTNDDFFFSIGDFYLLACMEKYSKDPVAKDCFEAYIDEMQINLISGSKKPNATEKDFPPDVKKKLERLKKLINY
jgi:hypothetical protein